MSKLLVSDELWNLVEPILPKHPFIPGVGKPRVPDRICLTGILFVLKTGIPWEDFPHEMGCCGMTRASAVQYTERCSVFLFVPTQLEVGFTSWSLPLSSPARSTAFLSLRPNRRQTHQSTR